MSQTTSIGGPAPRSRYMFDPEHPYAHEMLPTTRPVDYGMVDGTSYEGMLASPATQTGTAAAPETKPYTGRPNRLPRFF